MYIVFLLCIVLLPPVTELITEDISKDRELSLLVNVCTVLQHTCTNSYSYDCLSFSSLHKSFVLIILSIMSL